MVIDDELKCEGWHKPPVGYLKCNIDVGFIVQKEKTGVAMILRDEAGDFIVARMLCFPGVFQVLEGEAVGVPYALSWIYDLGFKRVYL
ncbi:hypothetical protein PTKIN_Ptkin02bG0215800 [Pterospermum kingtungense]